MVIFGKKKNQYEMTPLYAGMQFKDKTTVTGQQIENIIVDALEACSCYWVGVDNTTPEWESKPDDMPVSQYAVQLLMEGKSVTLFDIEDEDETWKLTMEKLLNGIGIALANGADIGAIENEPDIVLQYALFGELVYG